MNNLHKLELLLQLSDEELNIRYPFVPVQDVRGILKTLIAQFNNQQTSSQRLEASPLDASHAAPIAEQPAARHTVRCECFECGNYHNNEPSIPSNTIFPAKDVIIHLTPMRNLIIRKATNVDVPEGADYEWKDVLTLDLSFLFEAAEQMASEKKGKK